jgi:hypothetical protein
MRIPGRAFQSATQVTTSDLDAMLPGTVRLLTIEQFWDKVQKHRSPVLQSVREPADDYTSFPKWSGHLGDFKSEQF